MKDRFDLAVSAGSGRGARRVCRGCRSAPVVKSWSRAAARARYLGWAYIETGDLAAGVPLVERSLIVAYLGSQQPHKAAQLLQARLARRPSSRDQAWLA